MKHAVLMDFLGEGLEPDTAENMVMAIEIAQKQQKKKIKELKKEVEQRDKHVERLSQKNTGH